MTRPVAYAVVIRLRRTHTVRKTTSCGCVLVDGGCCDVDGRTGFLTVEEAAAVLRLGRSQAYELAQVWRAMGGQRGLPVQEFGRILRVPKAALLRLAGVLEPMPGVDRV
jgi:hypothetical protein